MIEAIINILIYLCIIAIVIYAVIYVLGVIGISLPPKIAQLLWVIFGLIAILLLLRILLPGLGGRRFGMVLEFVPLIT